MRTEPGLRVAVVARLRALFADKPSATAPCRHSRWRLPRLLSWSPELACHAPILHELDAARSCRPRLGQISPAKLCWTPGSTEIFYNQQRNDPFLNPVSAAQFELACHQRNQNCKNDKSHERHSPRRCENRSTKVRVRIRFTTTTITTTCILTAFFSPSSTHHFRPCGTTSHAFCNATTLLVTHTLRRWFGRRRRRKL